MVHYSFTMYLEKEELPKELREVMEKYNASILRPIRKEDDGRYSATVKLITPSALDTMNFMRECQKKGANPIVGGSYTPSLVERIIDFFKK